jgi:ubiquinone/menaquinone biosynthesis C-methylase UbiE
MKIEDGWKEIIKEYSSPTIIKNDLLAPFFFKKNFSEPVLDIGCGDGFFAKELSKKFEVIGVDVHDYKFDEFKYIKTDASKLSLVNSLVGDVLLINVLTCIDAELKRIQILKEAKRVKKPTSLIFVINTPESFIEKEIDSPLIKVRKLSKNKVNIDVLKMDGSWISFPDYVIKNVEFERYVNEAELSVVETKLFAHPKLGSAVYKLWVLK